MHVLNDIRNEDGAVVAPCLGLMQYQSGYDAVQYYVDNIDQYWPDAVPSRTTSAC